MKKLLALLLCAALCLSLIACQFSDAPSILPTFDDWLSGSGYQTTTTLNPDGTVTTTLTPPTPTASKPTTVPSAIPTTIPTPTPVPSVTPSTVPTTTPTTAPTTKPTTAPTTKPTTPSTGSSFSVHFIDVGQADAALVECDGHYMLIDGGNKADSNVIYSVLQRTGVKKLDIVVGTHAHEDHIGGLPGAFNYTTADLTLCPVTSYSTKAFSDFARFANEKGGGIVVPKKGATYSLGSATVKILGLNFDSDPNNTSIVLRIDYGQTSFLFTGDAEREAEQALLNSGANLKADVLKVGHHGSNSSTTYPFLRQIMPQYAVISVGAGNSYGHPTENTLSRLRDADVKTFRTDMQGDIFCTSDGKEVSFAVSRNADANVFGDLGGNTQTTTKPTTKPTTAPTTKPTTAPTTKPTTQPTTSSPAVHTPLPYTQRYLYNLLTEQEKGWYRKIDAAVNSLQDTVSLGVDLTTNERYNIYFIYMFDNPEHFYLGGRVSYSGSGNLYMSYSDGTTNCYRGGAVERLTDTMRQNIRSRKAAFDAEVQRIVSDIPAELSPAKKELMIYDRLLIDMHYNQKAATNNDWDGVAEVNWTAYGGIIHKTGVCEAYAEAFQTLCYAVGINCTGVVGTTGGVSHKWNAVELDGQWYAVDVTFDDPLSADGSDYRPGVANFHNYFNITSSKMAEDHSTGGSSYPGPNCTGTKYHYNSVK